MLSLSVANAQNFDFNQNCTLAYNEIISLKLTQGKTYLRIEKFNHPNNLIPVLLENYIDFLTVYTSGSSTQYTNIKKDFDARLNTLKNGDKSSPYYLYAQAEIHIQSAVLHIKFGEYWATIFDIKKALKKLETNTKEFPDFVPNYKSLGMLYTILGSIPQQYQGGLEFIGLKGEINTGLSYLNKAVKSNNHPFQHEAATVYAFMMLHIQNDGEKAWQVLKNNNFSATINLMDAFAFGHIGIYGKHNDEGIQALLNRPKSTKYEAFPLVNYLIGIGKTHKQDEDANNYFTAFIKENKGEDYIKSAYHKMAWNELIKGNKASYNTLLNKINTEGRAVLDADKQALKEYEKQQEPNPILLKARLLTDGNYLDLALQTLQDKNVNDFKNDAYKTEYFYRLARIYDKGNQQKLAIQYYKITIANGENVAYYYAANSAYLLGFIYEKNKNFVEAKKYYNLCLNLNGYEYENSIHQKAEAGLNRIK